LELEADDEEIESRMERFRYDNDLISAEEMEAWLEARGLTTGEFQGYFTRDYWLHFLKEKVAPEEVDLSRIDDDMLGMLECDPFLSRAFGPLAVALSRRLVAHAAAETPPNEGQVEEERRQFMQRTGLDPDRLQGWLESIGRDQGWLDGMIEKEVSYRLRCESVLTNERLSRGMASLRLTLTRVKLETVEFDSTDAMHEAVLCVREDGLSLEEVAREARYPFTMLDLLADDLDEDARQKLLCASVGELQELSPAPGIFRLCRVLSKTEPDIADASIRSRIEQRILDTHFSDASSKDLRWFIQ